MRLVPLVLSAAVALAAPASAQVAAAEAAGRSAAFAPVGPALDFALAPTQLQERYQAATTRLDSALSAIAAVPAGEVDFRNTVRAYEQATADWARAVGPIGFLANVSPDPAVRAAAVELKNRLSAYEVRLYHREDLYRQFEAAAAKGEKLDPADARLLEQTVKGFRENGFALSAPDREKLASMQERLGKLSNEFARNIAESNDPLVVGEESLKGLPSDYVAGLERLPDGRYKIAVGEATITTFLRYADDAQARKQLLLKFNNRAADKNLAVLHEALGLRRDIARLLGAKDYPELATKDRMAGTPQRVYDFLNRLKDAVLGRARRDLAEILEVKRRFEPGATRVEAWDRGYYSRILKQERYDYDPEAVKDYFPVDRVVEGTMKVYQRMLGVRFRELAAGPKWHPDVRLFEITDVETGRRVGHFYLDLYPREGKYTHAAAFTLLQGRAREDGSYEEPASAMVANFPKASPGRPALMPHEDVKTFFHEFGHLMHQTLTKARYATFSGSSVARDFVEAPSQMMENFVRERAVLDELSGHWKDGSKLPDELFRKMLAARDFQSGAFYAGQLGLAMGDLFLHTAVPDDVSAAFDKILAEFTGVATVPGSHFVASFGHLFGYGAGYYSYLWSKVFAQDIYTLFKAPGADLSAVGAKYRKEILETGSERPEAASLRAFLGREPSEEAFMREIRDEQK